MKILFVLQHVNYFRALDPVARVLHTRGHTVSVLHGGGAAKKGRSAVQSGRGLESCRNELDGMAVAFRGLNVDPWHTFMSVGRQVVNCSIFMRPEHPSGYRGLSLEQRLPPRVQQIISRQWVRWLVRQPATQKLWRWVEAGSPASPRILAQLDEYRPDAVLISPTVWPKDPTEADYLHAARVRGIPTAGFVASWDNLTSKGTIHVIPDVLMLWNQPLAEEAIALHHVPRQAIRIVGAPYLDHWFMLRQTSTRAEVCRRIGCETDQPFVLYFCSSPTLITSELDIVTALADSIERRLGSRIALVVRPHPTNAYIWNDYNDPRVVVWPKGGDLADTAEAWQDYYNVVAASSGAIGLNTTAFLEVAIADRPCITLLSDQYRMAQTATGHFRHLQAGEFLEPAGTIDQLADIVGAVGSGTDLRAEQRRRFVESFLRPYGRNVPASVVIADVLESLARPQPIASRWAAAPTTRQLSDPLPGLVVRG